MARSDSTPIAPIAIGLSAAIVGLQNQTPLILTIRDGDDANTKDMLPFGPYDPLRHRTFELGLRAFVKAQTGLHIAHVEQLYTFGKTNRDPRRRIVSVAYFGLVKSNQFKKAKYLLLLPLLASMLIYTSCETSQIEEVEAPSSKELQTTYLDLFSTERITNGKKETYLDLYMGDKTPKGKEIEYDALRAEEKEEYDSFYDELFKDKVATNKFISKIKLYRNEKGRGIVALIFNLKNYKSTSTNANKITEVEEITEDVPFAVIENVPVFPGCKGTRKEKSDCLNSSIKKSVITNFNTNLSKGLNLSTGKKKIWVTFRIDESGNVTNINARAPHPILKKEAIRVASLLPKMIPGKQRGKAVGMKYTLPISFNVE